MKIKSFKGRRLLLDYEVAFVSEATEIPEAEIKKIEDLEKKIEKLNNFYSTAEDAEKF